MWMQARRNWWNESPAPKSSPAPTWCNWCRRCSPRTRLPAIAAPRPLCLAAKDAAFAFITQRLTVGQPLTEYDVQQQIAAFFDAANLEYDHPPIVSVNAHAADPHYAPTADSHSPIQLGDMVLIDLWAKERATPLDCYADITWVGYCGREVPQRVQELFAVVAAGRDAAVRFANERLAAGQTVHGYEVDDACRNVIATAGYGAAFIHRTGHSLGVTVHYNGVNIDNLETRDRRSLIPHVMFTVEPGIYLPDFNFDGGAVAKGLGLRTEINCLVQPDGIEVTTLPLQTEVSHCCSETPLRPGWEEA